jgi:hypothetical protein
LQLQEINLCSRKVINQKSPIITEEEVEETQLDQNKIVEKQSVTSQENNQHSKTTPFPERLLIEKQEK